MSSLDASSAKYPSPRLQLVHKRPLTLPVRWSWSTCITKCLPPAFSVKHIAQPPFCLRSMASYSSKVMPYVDLSRPALAFPDNLNFKAAILIFSGFFEFHVAAGADRQRLHRVAMIVLLFAFKLNSLLGLCFRHFLHCIIRPFYICKWLACMVDEDPDEQFEWYDTEDEEGETQ